jgi:hypothetical protein
LRHALDALSQTLPYVRRAQYADLDHDGPIDGDLFGCGELISRDAMCRIKATWRKLMKAIILTHYGSPDVLRLEEIDKPVVPDDGVLLRVHASSVNIVDLFSLTRTAYIRGFHPQSTAL